jgi:hypothetical protein
VFFRIFWTLFALVFALLAFCGFGPTGDAGPLNPFGLAFLFIAFVVWRAWGIITGGFSPALMDGAARPLVDPASRDEHYR